MNKQYIFLLLGLTLIFIIISQIILYCMKHYRKCLNINLNQDITTINIDNNLCDKPPPPYTNQSIPPLYTQ